MSAAHLRFLTLNLWGENGPWEARMGLVGAALDQLQPDVVALQEVRDVPGRITNQAEALGAPRGYALAFAPATHWGGGDEGLAVLSRIPVGAQESRVLPHATDTEGRIILSVRLDWAHGPLWVHTTHLSYREHEGRQREDQVFAVDAAVAAHKNDNPQVVMGDFNTVPHADEIRWLCGLTTLDGRRTYYQDAWDIMHPGVAGYTWARANPYTARMGWLRADRRLDYIFVTPARRDGRGTVRGAQRVFDAPSQLPDGDLLFASDHFGVLADVQMLPTAQAG